MEYYSAVKRNTFESVRFSAVQSLSRVLLFTTPWTAAYQVPPSMGFSRQEYTRGGFVLMYGKTNTIL